MNFIRFFFLFFLFCFTLFADVLLKAPNSFVKGEPYYFELEASGGSLSFPKIEEIAGFVVEDQGTSRSMQYINGDYSEKIMKRYKIVPTKEFEIPSFSFKIDNKEFKTKAKKVTLRDVQKTNSDDFDLTLIPSKTSLYVGEDLKVKLIFKYKRDLQITNLSFDRPHFENFWYKKIDNSNRRYEDNGYIIQELDFLLFPQKSEKLTIGPLKVDVQMVEASRNRPFSFFTNVPIEKKIYSNRLEFDVKNLPENISLIGDFNIKATVNKLKLKQGESLSLRLTIDGVGNFDDIEDIKLDIPNATIYDNKPEIKAQYGSRGYEGIYTKIFSIIPNNSLVIPSIVLSYFNKKENKVITKRSDSFNIEVENSEIKKSILEKPKEEEIDKSNSVEIKELDLQQKFKYFIFGIIATLLIFGLYTLVTLPKEKKMQKETSLSYLVKKAKSKEQLIKLLLPYIKRDEKLDNLIFECESNKEFKLLKKEILARIKEINI